MTTPIPMKNKIIKGYVCIWRHLKSRKDWQIILKKPLNKTLKGLAVDVYPCEIKIK